VAATEAQYSLSSHEEIPSPRRLFNLIILVLPGAFAFARVPAMAVPVALGAHPVVRK
jgi:hypothetical protein